MIRSCDDALLDFLDLFFLTRSRCILVQTVVLKRLIGRTHLPTLKPSKIYLWHDNSKVNPVKKMR